ncbi:MAG: hypothetical protein E7005_02790 [Alphaproteobacteria bacterium]|nr:hypothetical protein [Alphaproteobacteria bacterium]
MKKSVFAIAMMVVALATSVSANAQVINVKGRKIQTVEMSDSAVIAHFMANQTDTLRVLVKTETKGEVVKYFVKKYYMASGKNIVKDNETILDGFVVVNDSTTVAMVDDLSERAKLNVNLDNCFDHKKLDVESYEVNLGGETYMAPKKYALKDGASLVAGIGYRYATEGISTPVLNLGVSHSQSWYRIALMGQLAMNEYNKFAQDGLKHQKYATYGTKLHVGLKPFKLDRFDQHRLYITGGLLWEWYKTGSENFSSWGNRFDPSVGLEYSYRWFATGNEIAFGVEYINSGSVVQNSQEIKIHQVQATVKFYFGLFRHKTNLSK